MKLKDRFLFFLEFFFAENQLVFKKKNIVYTVFLPVVQLKRFFGLLLTKCREASEASGTKWSEFVSWRGLQRKCPCVRPSEKNSAELIGITARPISIIFFKTISYQIEKMIFFLFENLFLRKLEKNLWGAKKNFQMFF